MGERLVLTGAAVCIEPLEALQPGTAFASRSPYGETVVRRRNAALAISRFRQLEPLGDQRELYYEQKLLLGLAWHCPDLKPAVETQTNGEAHTTWRFVSVPPRPMDIGAEVAPVEVHFGRHQPKSMEDKCYELERLYANQFACKCCAREFQFVCHTCADAIGFHKCVNPDGDSKVRWCCGTLHGGSIDIERVLYRWHKKGGDLENLRAKAAEYVGAGHLSHDQARAILNRIEIEKNVSRDPGFLQAADDLLAIGPKHVRTASYI